MVSVFIGDVLRIIRRERCFFLVCVTIKGILCTFIKKMEHCLWRSLQAGVVVAIPCAIGGALVCYGAGYWFGSGVTQSRDMKDRERAGEIVGRWGAWWGGFLGGLAGFFWGFTRVLVVATVLNADIIVTDIFGWFRRS